MSAKIVIQRQLRHIRAGGWPELRRKISLVFGRLTWILWLPLRILAIPAVLALRLIRPWLLVRIGRLRGARLGHLAANPEMYLCERDTGINAPPQRYLDLFYPDSPFCNLQLAAMWGRRLRILPRWVLGPIDDVNRFLPGGARHEVGTNTQSDRDVHNLLDRLPAHLEFTEEEIALGEAVLRQAGVPPGAPFVCLNVRDGAYLRAHLPAWDTSYHDYRDSDVQSYALAAEALAERGYFVFRVGARVERPMKTSHARIIDYATNGMRSDFMDVFLAARCAFCLSTGSGFDSLPAVTFRRPVAYVNIVPLGALYTFSERFLAIAKHHVPIDGGGPLPLAEIFRSGVGFSVKTAGYAARGVRLIDNTPEEIRDLVIEMAERVEGTLTSSGEDEVLQGRFRAAFKAAVDVTSERQMHGEIRSRFGAAFLGQNREWL